MLEVLLNKKDDEDKGINMGVEMELTRCKRLPTIKIKWVLDLKELVTLKV